MRIKLSPLIVDKQLVAVKSGKKLILNGVEYDFSRMAEGDTLPREAIDSEWFAADLHHNNIQVINGELVLVLTLPIPPENYSQEQAFPSDLVDVPDGLIIFPPPIMPEGAEIIYPEIPTHVVPGIIDWSKLVTQQMKDDLLAADHLTAMKLELTSRNQLASLQIMRIQDRIETIGYGIDIGEATEEDVEEQEKLTLSLKTWKSYKFSLGKITSQPSWPSNPVWPSTPPIPEIEASPVARGE